MERMIVAARPAALAVGSRYVREAVWARRLAPLARGAGDARPQGDRVRPRQLPAAHAAGGAAHRGLPGAQGPRAEARRPQAPGIEGDRPRARGAEARPTAVPRRPPR